MTFLMRGIVTHPSQDGGFRPQPLKAGLIRRLAERGGTVKELQAIPDSGRALHQGRRPAGTLGGRHCEAFTRLNRLTDRGGCLAHSQAVVIQRKNFQNG
jgi:hypothetical protein